jgi:hypothetical protein
MNKIFIFYAIFFIALLFLSEKYKLYANPKYKFYVKLFIATNVMFTIYVIFFQASNHNEEILNNHSVFYDKIMSKLKHGTISLFQNNPKMKYFFDELVNNNNLSSESDYLTHRDHEMEIIISYNIMDTLADFAVFYYSHVDLDNYRKLLISQRYTVIKTFNRYLKSDIFRSHADTYLNNVGGLNTLKFCKEFFNIVQTNPDDEYEKIIASSKIVNGKIFKDGREITLF